MLSEHANAAPTAYTLTMRTLDVKPCSLRRTSVSNGDLIRAFSTLFSASRPEPNTYHRTVSRTIMTRCRAIPDSYKPVRPRALATGDSPKWFWQRLIVVLQSEGRALSSSVLLPRRQA